MVLDFKDEQQENLLTLIKRLDQIPGIERLRLGSLEPRIVTREFAQRAGEAADHLPALPSVTPEWL